MNRYPQRETLKTPLASKWICLTGVVVICGLTYLFAHLFSASAPLLGWVRRLAIVSQAFSALVLWLRAHHRRATSEGDDVSPAIDELSDAKIYLVLAMMVCTVLGLCETIA